MPTLFAVVFFRSHSPSAHSFDSTISTYILFIILRLICTAFSTFLLVFLRSVKGTVRLSMLCIDLGGWSKIRRQKIRGLFLYDPQYDRKVPSFPNTFWIRNGAFAFYFVAFVAGVVWYSYRLQYLYPTAPFFSIHKNRSTVWLPRESKLSYSASLTHTWRVSLKQTKNFAVRTGTKKFGLVRCFEPLSKQPNQT